VRVTASNVTRAPEESAAWRTRRSRTDTSSDESSARRIGGLKRSARRASVSRRWSRRLRSSDGATPR
jgi:hypothetical protein